MAHDIGMWIREGELMWEAIIVVLDLREKLVMCHYIGSNYITGLVF